jgi:hypothetical protein
VAAPLLFLIAYWGQVFDPSEMKSIGGYILVDDTPADPKIVRFNGSLVTHNLPED